MRCQRPHFPNRVSAAGFSSRLYLPVSNPLSSGKYGRMPTFCFSATGTRSVSMPRNKRLYRFCAVTNAVELFAPATSPASASCAPGVVRTADSPDFSLLHEIFERAQRFVDRCARIRKVLLIEVNVVCAKTLQAGFYRLHDVFPRSAAFIGAAAAAPILRRIWLPR